MTVLRRLVLLLLAAAVLLAAVLGVNTLRQGSRQVQVPPAPALAVDTAQLADTLGAAIRLRTVTSVDDAALNETEFRQLHALLAQRFPRVHASLRREAVGLALVYTWEGTDPAAKPVALMAHQDVVPIAPGTEAQWQHPPFTGTVQGGYVWGRGAWDDKGNLVAQLQAVEMLLAQDFRPRQTVYLVFGADEEVGGARGAARIAELLRSRGVHLDWALDEGLIITRGVLPGVAPPVALVGIAEKGTASVLVKARAPAGHSSMPPGVGEGSIARLAGALERLDNRRLPGHLRGVTRDMFETLAPEMHGLQRVVLSNLWLTEPLVRAPLEGSPATRALLRTTTAITVVRGGNKDNVLPGEAEAVVNFRMLPGDTRDSVLRHVRATVGEGFELSLLPGDADPSPVSSTRSSGWRHIERTLRAVYPDTLVAPGLMIAGTDARHFVPIADQVFRFSPVVAGAADLPRLHGTNERLSIDNLAQLVRFYHQLLHNLKEGSP